MLVANETEFDALRESLGMELEKTRQKLLQLERAYSALNPESDPKAVRYAKMRVWIAVREYLRTVGGKASVTDILDALARGGANLGRYPLRTIKIAVNSPYMRQTFRVDTVGNDDVVSLRKDDSTRGPADGHRPRSSLAGKRPRSS